VDISDGQLCAINGLMRRDQVGRGPLPVHGGAFMCFVP
jgi:hypothetical protein